MRLRTMVLALALALGLAGLAAAQEEPSGSWFGRLFHGGAKTDADSAKKSETSAPAEMTPARRFQKAKKAWLRRVEVCNALREQADRLEDEDLRRKADLLDQRAWDAFQAATGSARVESNTKEKGR